MAYTDDQIQQIVDWFFTQGTRQYIGSRYVPVFADPIAHSSSRTYEPLTIVQHQGNSYTSKQYVPTGIAVTDTRYWALTGNYNAQIEQYHQEVQNVSGTVNDLVITVDNLEETSFPANAFKGSNIIGFGDSNMWGQGPTRSIIDRLASKLGATYTNYGVRGATWQNLSSEYTAGGFIEQVNNASSEGANDVKLVVVIGGINDYHYLPYNATDFSQAITTVINAINVKYPNAIVLCGFDGGMQLPQRSIMLYEQAILRRGAGYVSQYGRSIVANTGCLCTNQGLFESQNHYNDNGAEAFATILYSALIGGEHAYQVPSYKQYIDHFTANPTDTGFIGLSQKTVTELIFENGLLRKDNHNIVFASSFNNTDSTMTTIQALTPILKLPGSISTKHPFESFYPALASTYEHFMPVNGMQYHTTNSSPDEFIKSIPFVVGQRKTNYASKTANPELELFSLVDLPISTFHTAQLTVFDFTTICEV